MTFKRIIATAALASLAATLAPTTVQADGAASTRNILFGAAAATYLIIQHNRKVHERYAEASRRQAQFESANNQAWAAYNSEKAAYDSARAEIVDLKREVAYQHRVIAGQRNQLTSAGFTRVAAAQTGPSERVALVSYGWGQL